MMKICFRVDANSHIGQGHVMRCLSIALYARKNKLFDSLFAIADGETEKLFIDNDFEYLKLGISYKDYSQKSANILIDRLQAYDIKVIFVDSYYITNYFINTVKTRYKTACFFCKEETMCADLIVNYNINYNADFYEKNYQDKSCKLLLGSKFVPLREEFSSLTHAKKSERKKILFLTGGSDPYNMVDRFLVLSKELAQYDITIVIGKYSKVEHINKTTKNVRCIPPSKNIAKIMAENDIVVSAGGTTMYELCAIGVPTIIYSMADNQISESTYMGQVGCVDYIGDVREGVPFWNKLKESINQLANDECKINKMISMMKNVVDGQGCRRISEKIMKIGEMKFE